MSRRARQILFIGALAAASLVGACIGVTPTEEGKIGIGPFIPIAGEVYFIELASFQTFKVSANGGPVRQAGAINLFDGVPLEPPSNASMRLDANRVQVKPLDVNKGRAQQLTITGSASIDVYIAGADSASPCEDGVHVGSLELSFQDGVVYVETASLTLPSAAFDEVLTGAFTICLAVTADVSVTLTIEELIIEFGPAETAPGEPGGGAGGSTDGGQAGGSSGTGGQDSGQPPPTGPVQYTLTVTVEGDGSVSPSGGQYDAGQSVTLTATPATTWRFDNWEGDLSGHDNPATITMNDDKNVTAVFVTPQTAAITHYGVAVRIGDTDSLGESPWPYSVVSGDGSTVVFTASDSSAYVANPDGSDLTRYDLPMFEHERSVTISHDGARVFFGGNPAGGYDPMIVKLEGGDLTSINLSGMPEDSAPRDVQTTADGQYVYFGWCYDVWRVRHDGTGLEKVVEDTAVPRDSGASRWVEEFAISSDGDPIAFKITRYQPATGPVEIKNEIFVLVGGPGGTYHQLTNDDPPCGKEHLVISPDGSTIAFKAFPPSRWERIRPDGSGRIVLESLPGDGFLACDHDGSSLVHTTGLALSADGALFDLLPWGLHDIGGALSTSGDGQCLSLIQRYQGLPVSKYAAYGVQLNDPDAVADAPTVEWIAFDPPVMSDDDSDAQVILTVQVSHPQGLGDLASVSLEPYVDGQNVRGSAPIRLGRLKDDGVAPDEAAGDGIYTSVCTPASSVDEFDELTIRVHVRDARDTYVIADAVLPIGP